MNTDYRFDIWKNGKIVSSCQKLSTVLTRLLALAKKSNPENDSIWVYDNQTGETFDISEYIPTFTTK